jgi:1-deoxy-D-xylulose-5-phosphate synthase
MRKMPKGEFALKLGHKAEEALKGAVTPVSLQHSPADMEADGRGGFGSSLIFEEMGLRYLGPIDGHNLPLLMSTLSFAKTCEHPVVIHVLTKKGKGYDVAIQQPEKFHGTGP